MTNEPTATEHTTRTEVIAAEPVESLAAMLDIAVPIAGAVPPMWHWLYLVERRRHSELGPDGHPTSGIPAPPGPGRRRMFAGGRVRTGALLRVGRKATKVTRVASAVDKRGRTGPLTFITVRIEIVQDDRLAIVEEQDIVYRSGSGGPLPAPADAPARPPGPALSLSVDEAMLFRFSALTYNAHRIHYDLGWVAREGYDALVVHGPLQALMMAEHLRREGIDVRGRTFGYRLVAPMLGPQTFTVVPGPDGLTRGTQVRAATGAVCATSTLSEETADAAPR